MAGRLHITSLSLDGLLPRLAVDQPLNTSPNLAPRRPLSIIRLEQGRPKLVDAFWGLTPPWLKVLDHASHCARVESLEERAMFREAFAARRCLIPVSGVYVWKALPRWKQPFLVTRVDRGPMLLGALWVRFHTTLTAYTDSTALITMPANPLLAPLTDRFPAVIDPSYAEAWLDPETPLEQVRDHLLPAPLELLGAFPVSRRVNDPSCQDWACAYPTGNMARWQSEQEK
ncbi:SOS response-associated peptidase [Halomonas sp. GXIMD04776]|uniref:SOS response-associated peptidase n=1 Tax=Halomonas sp. GXIMD04776 TaxID=3415605 RepID=UPI003CA509DB